MRQYHRWIATVSLVLAVYLAVSGSVLAIDEIVAPAALADGATAPPAPAPLPSADALVRMSAMVVRTALAAAPDATLHALRLQFQMRDGKVLGVITLAGASSQTLIIDAESGQRIPSTADKREKPPRSLNDYLQDLHSGAIAGRWAQWFILAAGVGIVALAFTGAWMFFQLRKARRTAGYVGWFWSLRD